MGEPDIVSGPTGAFSAISGALPCQFNKNRISSYANMSS